RSVEWTTIFRVQQRTLLPQLLHAGHLGPLESHDRSGLRAAGPLGIAQQPQQPSLAARSALPQQQPVIRHGVRQGVLSRLPQLRIVRMSREWFLLKVKSQRQIAISYSRERQPL
ncbi:hypothetical protein AVEN_55612-1, partial [Araneus ventricosus]